MNIMHLLHPVSFEELTEYAFKGLKASKGEIVQAHLATCARCSAQVRRLRLIREAFQLDTAKSPPAELYTRAQSIFATRPQPLASRAVSFQAIGFRPRLAPAFAVAAILLLFAIGAYFVGPTISSSVTEAIPGDSLYALKIAGESVQLALAFNTVSNLQAHLTFTQNRVTEIEKLVNMNRTEQIPETLSAFQKELAQVTSAFDTLIGENPASAKAFEPAVQLVLSHSNEILNAALVLVPAPIQVVIRVAIDAVSQAETQIAADLESSGTEQTQTPTPTMQNTRPALPTQTPTVLLATPTRTLPVPQPTNTPTIQPNILTQPTATPVDKDTPTPGKVPPGQTKTPPGQDKTPSGQDKTPTGQGPTPGNRLGATPQGERH
jgi:hypothetical protein